MPQLNNDQLSELEKIFQEDVREGELKRALGATGIGELGNFDAIKGEGDYRDQVHTLIDLHSRNNRTLEFLIRVYKCISSQQLKTWILDHWPSVLAQREAEPDLFKEWLVVQLSRSRLRATAARLSMVGLILIAVLASVAAAAWIIQLNRTGVSLSPQFAAATPETVPDELLADYNRLSQDGALLYFLQLGPYRSAVSLNKIAIHPALAAYKIDQHVATRITKQNAVQKLEVTDAADSLSLDIPRLEQGDSVIVIFQLKAPDHVPAPTPAEAAHFFRVEIEP